MHKTRQSITRKLTSLLIGVLIIGILSATLGSVSAEAKSETTTLRIISTGDLHGQLTTTNYDSAGEHTGSLAQVHTLINSARKAIKNGNSITVDLGDTIYGYGTDYVISNNGTEYMYKAMKNIGYDAILLGNHDLDYGYEYTKKQLKASGLSDLCVVSNVYDVETGKTVWNQNKIITKKLKTNTGRTISVKIGIAGVTLPSLTTYYNHAGILSTKTMAESVKEQVAALQKKNADIIIVLAHGNMGSAGTEEIYDITKIDGVDAIMFGHPHVNFPSDDNNVASYYKLPGVNKETGLINGIPVVSVSDHGIGIGIADLTLSVNSSGKVSVKKSAAKISYVKSSTTSSSDITKFKSLYEAEIKATYEKTIGALEDAASVTNYFGLLSDNKALQLTNEAKIQLGLSYINEKHSDLSDYANYPVIAVSNYKKYGKESYSDYINVSGQITVGDILSIQSYNHEYTCIYEITGKQLREWLEYCASAYEKTGSSKKWPDSNINNYVEKKGLSPVLMPEWTNNWSNFSIFDGIEYTIDTSQPARYDIYGNVIAYGYSRISSLTYNGRAITDDTRLILVSDYIAPSKPVVGAALSEQRLKKTDIHSSILLSQYISKQMEFGAIPGTADDNWHVDFPTGSHYLVRSSSLSLTEAQNQPWYVSDLKTTDNYIYYQAAFTSGSYQDTNGPTLVLAPTIEVETNRNIPVMVQATDPSGVVSCKYVEGYHDVDDAIWNISPITISGNYFTATQNGTYSVMAMDIYGNKTVKHITISNINTNILQVPSVDNYTNRKTVISGSGEPNAAIYFSCKTGTYESIVAPDGTFSYELPAQEADTTVKVQLSDSTGRKSAIVNVPVNRTGPNLPTVNTLTNKQDKITGDLNDTTSQIFAIVGSKVYVAKNGGKEAYKASSVYNASKTIVTTDFSTSGTKFSFEIPIQKADTSIKVYAVDKIGRISRVSKLDVEGVAPNQPVVYTACNAENHIFGYVPESTGIYDITAVVDGKIYTGTTDSQGYFSIETDNLKANTIISVTASDVVNSTTRTSATGSRIVESYETYIEKENRYSLVTLYPVNSKSTTVMGELASGYLDALYLKVDGTCYTIQTSANGTFTFDLPETLEPDTKIHAVYRDKYSNIHETASITVSLALPDTPKLLTEVIYNNTTEVSILSKDPCTATVKINGKLYTSEKGTYNEELGGYVYQVEIEKSPANSTAYIFMENATGRGNKIQTSIVAKVPEISDLNQVTTASKKVTGSVTLVLPAETPEAEASTPTVENTETKVYAKVKGKDKKEKTYEGTIKENGTFKIVFDSKPEKGDKIVVWAENANGKSEKTTITVTEKNK